MNKVLIIDTTDYDATSSNYCIDDTDNNPEIILPIILKTIEPIDFPVRKRLKRRKFKSYFGKTYESEYG